MQAAIRLMDLALPLIEAGQSLRFAIMPEGQDPDDIIRAGGKSAMQALLDAAEPMVSLLWRRETEGKVFDSPERRAALDKSLREALRKIADPSLRRHYGDEVNQRRRDLFTPKRRAFVQGGNAPRKAGTRWQPPPPGANADTKGSLLARRQWRGGRPPARGGDPSHPFGPSRSGRRFHGRTGAHGFQRPPTTARSATPWFWARPTQIAKKLPRSLAKRLLKSCCAPAMCTTHRPCAVSIRNLSPCA